MRVITGMSASGKSLPVRVGDTRVRSQTKVQVEVRKGKPDQTSQAPEVCKLWSVGKCHRGRECVFQHPPKPTAPSAEDDRRGTSNRKKKTCSV